MSYLKAKFEHVGSLRLAGLLADEGWLPICGDLDYLIIKGNHDDINRLTKAIWAHNGGAWCEVTQLTDDEADAYM